MPGVVTLVCLVAKISAVLIVVRLKYRPGLSSFFALIFVTRRTRRRRAITTNVEAGVFLR